MNHEIYADHAATAPIEPLALEAMYTAYQEYANPAALYRSCLLYTSPSPRDCS